MAPYESCVKDTLSRVSQNESRRFVFLWTALPAAEYSFKRASGSGGYLPRQPSVNATVVSRDLAGDEGNVMFSKGLPLP